VEKTGEPGENHWQTLSHNVVDLALKKTKNKTRSQYSCLFYADPLESAGPQVFVGGGIPVVLSLVILLWKWWSTIPPIWFRTYGCTCSWRVALVTTLCDQVCQCLVTSRGNPATVVYDLWLYMLMASSTRYNIMCLTPPQFCVCSKPVPRFPTPYIFFFRNACTKSGSLRLSQFSGCWLILSVYIIMNLETLWYLLLAFGTFNVQLWTTTLSMIDMQLSYM
jgi:hypothetical protein